MTHQAVRFH